MSSNQAVKLLINVALLASLAISSIVSANAGFKRDIKKDISENSIVFDVKTPDVFYCPQEKQAKAEKMIVMAKPLEQLCEFGGKERLKGASSDCYNDVDETPFACEEKKRFLMRLEAEQVTTTSTMDVSYGIDNLDTKFVASKGLVKRKLPQKNKKLISN